MGTSICIYVSKIWGKDMSEFKIETLNKDIYGWESGEQGYILLS